MLKVQCPAMFTDRHKSKRCFQMSVTQSHNIKSQKFFSFLVDRCKQWCFLLLDALPFAQFWQAMHFTSDLFLTVCCEFRILFRSVSQRSSNMQQNDCVAFILLGEVEFQRLRRCNLSSVVSLASLGISALDSEDDLCQGHHMVIWQLMLWPMGFSRSQWLHSSAVEAKSLLSLCGTCGGSGYKVHPTYSLCTSKHWSDSKYQIDHPGYHLRSSPTTLVIWVGVMDKSTSKSPPFMALQQKN